MALILMEGFDWLPGGLYDNRVNNGAQNYPLTDPGTTHGAINTRNGITGEARIASDPYLVGQAIGGMYGSVYTCVGNKDLGKGYYFLNSPLLNSGQPANTPIWDWQHDAGSSPPASGLYVNGVGLYLNVNLPDFGDKLIFGFAWRKDFTNSLYSYPIFSLTGPLVTSATATLIDRGLAASQGTLGHRGQSAIPAGGGMEFRFMPGDIPTYIDGGATGTSAQGIRYVSTTKQAPPAGMNLNRWNAFIPTTEANSDLKYKMWNYIECVLDWPSKKMSLYINNVFQSEITVGATVKPTSLIIGPGLTCDSAVYNVTHASWGIDDLYILDGTGPAPLNDRLGIMKIYTDFPTADADVSFTRPVAGATSNWSQVASVSKPVTTAYLAVNVPDAYDLYTGQASILPTGKSIYAVSVGLMYQKTGPDAVQMAPIMKHGTDPILRNNTIGISAINAYGTGEAFFPLNPATGRAWTRNELIATAFGAVAV